MNKGQKRLRQINIMESFALNKKPKSQLQTSNMEKNLRDLMAAAAMKRIASADSESNPGNSGLQTSNVNIGGCGTSTAYVPESEKSQITVLEESCLSSSADLFSDSTELLSDSPNIEQCSSQETVSSNLIDSPPSTPNSAELFPEASITETDFQMEDDSAEEHQVSFLNRRPACSIPLPPLEPLENHSIMFSPHIRPGYAPRPYPASYRDRWDSDHVRMPCSPQNKFPIDDLNGERRIGSRWDLICRSLRRNIRSTEDLERAILLYNSQYRGKWSFNGLHALFETSYTENERCHFFETVLPAMIDMTLDLPNICTQPIPLLKRNKDHYVTMSQKQIGCLLLNAFFCTFPCRSYISRKQNSRWSHEFANYPDINFNRLFYGVRNRLSTRTEKLKCLLNYFRRITSKEPSGTVTFHRQYLQDLPIWEESKRGVRTAVIKADGLIETEGYGMLQVDFANKFVGGGVLGEGCVQEEIRFVICPELIVSRLFVERLGHSEVLIITGAEQYNKQSGYSRTFKWEGNFQDQTPRDAWGRRCTEVVAMDATHFVNSADQFELNNICRELNKAYCGFYEDAPSQNLPAVASGNWGCGAFNGDPSIKFLIQLMAASHTGRDLLYFTFGNKHLKKDLKNIYNLLAEKNLFVGDIWRILENFSGFCRTTKVKQPKVYDFLCSIFSNEDQIEDASQNKSEPELTDSDKHALAKLIEVVDEGSSTEVEDNDPG